MSLTESKISNAKNQKNLTHNDKKNRNRSKTDTDDRTRKGFNKFLYLYFMC